MVSSKDYVSVLEKWIKSTRDYLYTPPDRPGLLCYGTGYDSWGVQTQQKAFSAFAVLAADPSTDENTAGLSRDELYEYSVRMLRFNLETHKTGSYACFNGTKWGNSWISVLGIERMMHGIDALQGRLSENDRGMLRNVMLSEADYLTDCHLVKAGKTENNHPESNIWNGAHLYRTALMYPDCPRIKEYMDKGTSFIVNGISVASDAVSMETAAGKSVSERYAGDNFFETFALNHHGYLNIGYMYICLSNIAILYFEYRLRNLPVPELLLRHVRELWQLVKLSTFPDGRLCRIGGDTRVRYSYCQDYALPAWLMIYDLYGDRECKSFENGWFETVKRETAYNGDGSFLSARCQDLKNISPLYYTRLESDRAATFAMAAYWKRMLEPPVLNNPSKKARDLKEWHDSYHGACVCRGEKRMASWCWKAAEPPQGLCLPVDRSDMAEWRYNFSGRITGQGRFNGQRILFHREYLFEGGFCTVGETEIYSTGFFEGQSDEITGKNIMVFAALPDDTTVIIMEKAVACRRFYINELKGLNCNIPNDIFNGSVRIYRSSKGIRKVKGGNDGKEGTIEFLSPWINIDNRLGIVGLYGSDRFSLCRPPKRQAGLKLSQYESRAISTGLRADELCFPYKKGPLAVEKGETLFDMGCVILAGTGSRKTSLYSKSKVSVVRLEPPDSIRTVMAQGFNGKKYLLTANFGEKEERFSIPLKDSSRAVALTGKEKTETRKDRICISVKPCDIKLFEIARTKEKS